MYLPADQLHEYIPDNDDIRAHIRALCDKTGITIPNELLPPHGTFGFGVRPYGMESWGELFLPRQMFCLLSFVNEIKKTEKIINQSMNKGQANAVITFLAVILDRLADFNSSICLFNYAGGRGVKSTFGANRLQISWDFAETNPFNQAGASWVSGIKDVPKAIEEVNTSHAGIVCRGSSTQLPFEDAIFDNIITDPPYYDNIPYASISDFFYVWLKRTIGHIYPEHFAGQTTPKKTEAVADVMRHTKNKDKAKKAYEKMMAESFTEGHRLLKKNGQMAVVYAHKTTLGWTTLIDALRQAGFTVTEAWPLDTEKKGRVRAQESAALASSIFLIARKRDASLICLHESEVRSELKQIVRERVETLWEMSITGADLVIAAVGAGLGAFTRFSRVEYANGEEVPAERFLAEAKQWFWRPF